MEKLQQLVRDIAEDKPLAEIIKSHTGAGDNTQVMRINPIFEDWGGDAQLHAQWGFRAPSMMHAPFDLYRMVKDVVGSERTTGDAQECLLSLGRDVNELRARLVKGYATEQDHYRYLHFVESIGALLENSSVQYQISVPADDDGVNGEVAPWVALHYDSWTIERFVVLLSLLALHHAARTNGTKQRIDQYYKCIGCLREIQRLAAQPPPQTGERQTYKRAPTSLSSQAQRDTTQSATAPCTTVAQFIALYLGGAQCAEARVHLCEALRCEEIYGDTGVKGNAVAEIEVMSAIVDAYGQAARASVQHSTQSKLTHHARFMHHFWAARTNLCIAQQQDLQDKEGLKEAVERVSNVTRLHGAYKFDKRSFTLDGALVQQYNDVIVKADTLHRTQDPILYKTHCIRAEIRDFTFARPAAPERQSSFEQAMQAVRVQCDHEAFGRDLATLCIILGGKIGGTTTTTSATASQSDVARSLFSRALDGDSARLGVLIDRLIIVRWILSETQKAGEEQGFIVSGKNMQILQRALHDTEYALSLH